jgi:autotransporter-associated beta strand protein
MKQPITRKVFSAVLAVALVSWMQAAQAQETTLLNLQNVDPSAYTQYTFSFTAVLSQTYLTFQFRQDPDYWSLSDISLTATGLNTQLLTNNDFSGGSTPNSFGQQVPTAWTLIGQAGLEAGGTLQAGCGFTGGNCWFDGSVGGVDGLFQSFASTVGSSYTLSFWLSNGGGPINEAVVQVGASEDQGGTLVPVPPTPAATNIVAAGSPFLAAGLGTTLNPVFDGGTLQMDGSSAIFTQDFTINSTNGTTDIAGFSSTLSGVLSGPGGLTIANSASGGSLTFTGVNVYQGATTINAGATLALAGPGSIASSSGVADNGVFDISGTSAGAAIQSLSGSGLVTLGSQTLTLTGAADSFSGSITGAGGLSIAGGTETLSGSNAYTGATAIGSGATLALAGTGSIASSSSLADNGTFDISATSAGAALQSLAGSGTVSLGNQTLTLTNATDTFAGTISGAGGLSIAGGTETLSGANAYTGGTSIGNGATLSIAADAALGAAAGALTLDGGTLETTASMNTARAVTLAGNGNFETDVATTLADSGNVGGVGALFKSGSGTLMLCGKVSNSGGVMVSAGTLVVCGNDSGTGVTAVSSGATLAVTGSGSITQSSSINVDGTLDISGASNGALIQSLAGGGSVNLGSQALTLDNAAGSFTGTIGGGGSLAITGGVETLTGSNTYGGGTSVSGGGRLVISSDAALGAAGAPLSLNDGTLETTASMSTARPITIIASATLDTDPGTTLMQSGTISGNGHLVKQGDGTLVLAGDNSGWGQSGNPSLGGLTVDGGLVEVTNPYGLGYGTVTVNSGVIATTVDIATDQTIQIAGSTVLNTEAGTTTTLSGTVETGGAGSCFDKTGTGTLDISGTATLSNGTCVLQGRLNANGILNSNVLVDSGGTLRGTGLINGTVSVYGTLAPGNSPGTLTTTGRITMEPGSTFQEDINGIATGSGPGSYSRLLVMGPGNQFVASGGTLDVNLLNITGTASYTPYLPQIGDTFRIITAQGGIVGTFAAFDQPQGLLNGTRLAIFYDPLGDDSIVLRVVPISYGALLRSSGANANARSVGNALDQLMGAASGGHLDAAQEQMAFAVSGVGATALARVSTELAGEVHADLIAAAPQADQWLQASVMRQLDYAHAIDAGGGAEPGAGFWFDSTADHGHWGADDESAGFTSNRTQIALGFDLLAGQGNRAGIGFSHALTNVSTAGTGSVEENLGFLYGQYSIAALVFDALAGAGHSHFDTVRADPLALTPDSLETSRSGNSALASAGVRWPWHAGSVLLQPYVRTMWQRLSVVAFDEGTTPDALSGSGYRASGLRTTAGFSIGSVNASPLAAPFTYRLDLGVGRDDGSLLRPVLDANLAGVQTLIDAPEIGRSFGEFTLGATARLASHAYLYLGVGEELRSGRTEDLDVDAGVRASF